MFQEIGSSDRSNSLNGEAKISIRGIAPELIAEVILQNKQAAIVPDELTLQMLNEKIAPLGFSIEDCGTSLNVSSGAQVSASDMAERVQELRDQQLEDYVFKMRDAATGNISSFQSVRDALGLTPEDRVLMIDPHYDDSAFGGALFLEACALEGIQSRVVVVTDGGMGYGPGQSPEEIIEIRKRESNYAYGAIGISPENLIHLNYPDLGLHSHQGRRKATDSDPDPVAGYSGLRNSLVHRIREFAPTVIMLPTAQDFHIDHRITNQEAIFAIHSALGNKWPELGSALKKQPRVFEMAISRPFAELPTFAIESVSGFDRKAVSVKAFKSQGIVVDDLVAKLAQDGPSEFFLEIHPFRGVSFAPAYRDIFFPAASVERTPETVSQRLDQAFERARTILGEHVFTTELGKIDSLAILADEILSISSSSALLEQKWLQICDPQSSATPGMRLLSKLALSKSYLNELSEQGIIPEGTTLTFVIAMYGEQNRLRTPAEHENGEDSLRMKVKQLEWLSRGTNITPQLVFVDDGCPKGTGDVARSIARSEGYSNVTILALNDIIGTDHPMAVGLTSTNDSIKGGSIQYGLHEVLKRLNPNQKNILAYSDSDLTVDLRMAGLILKPLFVDNKKAAVGSKYSPLSYMDGPGSTGMNSPEMKTFIELRALLRRQFFGLMEKTPDIFCGFKAFDQETISQALAGMKEKRFSFDLELLLKVAMAQGPESIESVPIFISDSVAESTSRVSSTHLEGLQRMAVIFMRYKDMLSADDISPQASAVAEFISTISLESYEQLITKLLPKRLNLTLEDVLENN